ncbi:hypothetical protein [Kushneria aurantia]|uniref:Ketosynthase n=1 Tax=Kushneria aurantia TaxID=504092 RepID=A0ABV6FZK8_9GAMM|nr:hypothetical protein [Kushneria aurantia]
MPPRPPSSLLALLPLAALPLALWVVLPLLGVQALLIVLIALCLIAALRRSERRWLTLTLAALLSATLIGGRAEVGVRCYPVALNLALAAAFLASLARTPLIERLARLSEPGLPASGVRYTRRLTLVWGLLLSANTLAALATALWAPLWLWQLWNGALAYLPPALLMALEYPVRRRARRRAAA